MADVVPFTNNYRDVSTRDGYQFEFSCNRCGNGYKSQFRPSVMGMGGKVARLGGGLLGGTLGNKLERVGWNAEWVRDGVSGFGNDKHLAEAVEDVAEHFEQCHRCGQWVCNAICWNSDRGMCVSCAPKLDQEIAGMQAAAQIEQLQQKVKEQDWTQDVNVRDEVTALCASCGHETGGGKFCAFCGTPLAAAPAAMKKFCANCGTQWAGGNFCAECGTPA